MNPKTSQEGVKPRCTPVDVSSLPDTLEGMLLTPLGAVIDALVEAGANSWRYTDRLESGEAMTIVIVRGEKGAAALQTLSKQLMDTGRVPEIQEPTPVWSAEQIRVMSLMVTDAIREKQLQDEYERKTNAYYDYEDRGTALARELSDLVKLLDLLVHMA